MSMCYIVCKRSRCVQKIVCAREKCVILFPFLTLLRDGFRRHTCVNTLTTRNACVLTHLVLFLAGVVDKTD